MDFLLTLPGEMLILAVLVVLSFIFALAETSIIGLSKIRLRHMVAKGIRHAASVQRLVTKLDKFIAAILIGNNFVNIAISVMVTAIIVRTVGYRWGIIIATFFTTFFVLIFCEITPKILAAKHTEKSALIVAPLMEIVLKMLNPLVTFFTGISSVLLRAFGVGPSKRSPLITEEELRTMIEVGKDEGVLTDEERKMLHRIFEFGDIKVGDVMVAKEKIVAVNINVNPEELLNKFVEEGHARLPVYSQTIDNIIGVIYAHDLLYILRDKSLFLLQDLVHEPYYVNANIRINVLLQKFQSERIQIAIVVDQHKKTLGLVTLEDLVEEIVGDIDEKPKRMPLKKK